MDFATIISDVTGLLGLASTALKVIGTAEPYFSAAKQVLTSGQPLTNEQRQALLAGEQALRAELNRDQIAGDAA